MLYHRNGEKAKFDKVDVPLVYKFTSPYQNVIESYEFPGKKVCFLERSFEMRTQDPSLTPMQIRKLFNSEWPKVNTEMRDMFKQVAERMRSDPIKGIKGDTFNGIQCYK
jgi:hypothetical protein